MTEIATIVLLLVIITLCGLIGWMDWNNRKERKSLVNAIKAPNPVDFANLELADKTEIKTEVKEPDLIPLEQVDDKKFFESISTSRKK